MNRFIEVHVSGQPRLINTGWIEEIVVYGESAMIYFAYNLPTCDKQDYVMPDESYDELKELIFQGGTNR